MQGTDKMYSQSEFETPRPRELPRRPIDHGRIGEIAEILLRENGKRFRVDNGQVQRFLLGSYPSEQIKSLDQLHCHYTDWCRAAGVVGWHHREYLVQPLLASGDIAQAVLTPDGSVYEPSRASYRDLAQLLELEHHDGKKRIATKGEFDRIPPKLLKGIKYSDPAEESEQPTSPPKTKRSKKKTT